jgi:hypothetical protein
MCIKPAQAAEQMPCHGEQQNNSEKPGLTLMKDCLQIELAQADNNSAVKKSETEITKIYFGWADIVADYKFEQAASIHIRGPPIIASYATSSLPLYLTTQRLRI